MKALRVSFACVLLFMYSQAFGGIAEPAAGSAGEELNPERFDLALESGYLFGAINPPASYEIGAEFLTARIRWGIVDRESWLRGYNQFYVSAIAEPIFRGIEIIISESISAFGTISSNREADSFPTFLADSV